MANALTRRVVALPPRTPRVTIVDSHVRLGRAANELPRTMQPRTFSVISTAAAWWAET